MSTQETDEITLGNCPCGEGKIIRRITTQDNPWSSADISHRIDCARCSREWRIDNSLMVNNASEAPYRIATQRSSAAHEALHDFIRPLVNGYFLRFAAKTKKGELAEMTRLGVSNSSYRDFLKRKKEGNRPADLCWPLRNEEWVASLVKEANKESDFAGLRREWKSAAEEESATARKVVRRRLPEMTFN
jgi:hypothetical protein